MRIDLLTAFPRIIEGPIGQSIIKIGRERNIAEIALHDLRNYTHDKHRTVDDYPYGGGPGMVLKIEPVIEALDDIFRSKDPGSAHIILTSPKGTVFNQKMATQLSLKSHLVVLCGHYKGIDERIHEFYDIHEISIGDYVLSAGEIAALVIIDSVIRLLPGVIRDINSAWTDSFSDDLLDAPCYTRPEEFRDKKVPEVLLSGNHEKIERWRQEQREKITRTRRPDLYENYLKSIK